MSASVQEPLLPLGHDTRPTPFAALKERTSCILAGGQREAQAGSKVKNKFVLALCFSFLFMLVEVVGGYFANSLAIMTDAAHLLSDVGGFAVAIFAAQYASKRSQQSHTFGYHRVESIGVAAAGALIWWKQDDVRWQLADPICTFIFAILVLFTTKAILRDIWDILMERVPRQIDIDKLEQGMLAIDGVEEVHDLHVWLIKPGMPILAAHITSTGTSDASLILGSVTHYCRSFGIDHSTIQVHDHKDGGDHSHGQSDSDMV
ncbi:hypothetical protein WJX79_007846 [Trebouxia sp. C0005]